MIRLDSFIIDGLIRTKQFYANFLSDYVTLKSSNYSIIRYIRNNIQYYSNYSFYWKTLTLTFTLTPTLTLTPAGGSY